MTKRAVSLMDRPNPTQKTFKTIVSLPFSVFQKWECTGRWSFPTTRSIITTIPIGSRPRWWNTAGWH